MRTPTPAPRVAPALVVGVDAGHRAICLRCDRVLPGSHPLRSDALEALHAHGVTAHGEGSC